VEYAVSLEGICKSFSHVQVLDNVDFHLKPGEIHALVGENGAGKSTLIKILSGALVKDNGVIRIEDKEVDIQKPLDAKMLGVQCIYQELSLIPHLSVANNIFLGMEKHIRGFVKQKEINSLAKEMMLQFGLDIDVKTEVRFLGIGQQFFTEICRCLVGDAKIVIMDEPTSAMTPVEYAHFLMTIKLLRNRNISIIYISHRLDEIFEICDSVTILRNGKCVDTRAVSDITLPEMVRLMIGKDVSSFLRKIEEKDFTNAKIVLEMRNVSTAKLKNVSLSLHEGEVLGVTGLLGAGKTEIARALFGADKLTGGSILIDNEPLRFKHPIQAMNHKLALVPEDRKGTGLFQNFSIKENISLVNLLQMVVGWIFVNRRKENQFAANAVQSFNVKARGVGEPVKYLSGGNQQKVVLAKWMSRRPRVLLLDEPTRGIDVGSKEEIYNMICELAKAGISVVLFSSELPEVITLSNRIIVLHDGVVKGEILSREATQEKILLIAVGESQSGK
jgi:ribose transport system ATP-binding protein